MQKTIILILSCFLISQAVYSQDFYDINTINSIEIAFAESNWDQLLDQLYAAGNEERLVGTVLINGVEFDSVGIRYKGNSTYSANRTKNPLNIKLDYIINNQELDGYGTLKLANVWKDPSFVREVLGYEIARNYMPASKANFMKVSINGTNLGLYTSVQSVDKFFMETHFNSNENTRFKGELANSSPQNQVTVWGYTDADSASYYDFYELQSDAGWQDLVDFLNVFNNDTGNVEDVLNIDRHLWMLALDILMVNLDAPINFGHNYYLYQDDAGQFNPILWDLNENFGGFSMLLGQGGPPLSLANMQQLDPFLNSSNNTYPIVSKILSDSRYRKMYVAHVKTIMEEVFANDWYNTRAQEIQSVIDAEVQADPHKFYTYNDFLNNLDNTVGGGGPPGPGNQSIVGVAQLMSGRIAYLNTRSEFQAIAPTISEINNIPASVTPFSEVWLTAEVSDADQVMLAWRNSVSARFVKTEMFDDGNHNDGAAGDGVYGASVSSGGVELQYYIYVENNQAAKFSPERAAYEFYTLEVAAGALVINEFMADNDTVIPDQDGEYDDWIELYNNSDSPISLNGCFLSDDGGIPTHWAFPDTVIAANSYLIVWADEDLEQVGLHANFKLSKSGETIYLFNSDTLLIDEITFGAQTTDLSYGRYPNGTGEFTELMPSWAAENNVGTTGVSEEHTLDPSTFLLAQNYPNPFNPRTTITFELPVSNQTSLVVYNIIGQQVATLVEENLTAGQHQFHWNAQNMPSGIYFYTLNSGMQSETKRMILLK